MKSSYRTRLILIFGGLFAIALSVLFFGLNHAQRSAAETSVREDLARDSKVFDRLVAMRSGLLLEIARSVSSDFAFKRAYFDGDTATIRSALRNFFSRADSADVAMLLSLDGELEASTEEDASLPRETEVVLEAWQEALYAAEDDEFLETSAILPLGDRLLQTVVVPLRAPDVEAWVVAGFQFDQEFADEFQQLTRAEISILRARDDGTWKRDVSSHQLEQTSAALENMLDPSELDLDSSDEDSPNRDSSVGESAEGDSSEGDFVHGDSAESGNRVMTKNLAGRDFLTSVIQLAQEPSQTVAVLQRPLDEELAAWERTRKLLLAFFALGLLMAVAGSVLAAGSVTKPVLAIADAASRIQQGDYDQEVVLSGGGRTDEIGQMAQSFNHMARGLAEKERVRNLLGKVVSPAIAEELMRRDVNLGGEEREVTILFSDVRSFTNLCEGRSPQAILELLNLYLTEVSTVISDHGGVVDKYIGDAVMALFGAPVESPDDPGNAVLAAQGMMEAVARVNPQLEADGWPPLEIGIGINTDVVVAGNMGSMERLNYTVIGDGVNLAARLEGLTKIYGLPILVTESTATHAPGILFRELDRVRVKGKQEPVSLYEPMGPASSQAPEGAINLTEDLFAKGLRLYQHQSWTKASACFQSFGEENPSREKLSELFLHRIEDLSRRPPGDNWDMTHTFTEK